jgi:hypothetical protein
MDVALINALSTAFSSWITMHSPFVVLIGIKGKLLEICEILGRFVDQYIRDKVILRDVLSFK